MRRRVPASAAATVLSLLLLVSAPGSAVSFEVQRIQYHYGDVILVTGSAGNNTTLFIQVYGGQDRLFSNYTKANATGFFLIGFRVDESWPLGSKILMVTDIPTGAFAYVEFEIVERPVDVANANLEAARTWERVFWMALGFVTVLSLMLVIIMGGYMEYRTKRLTLRQTLGRFGGLVDAWSDRWWWQLTTFLQPDGNYLEGTPSGHHSFYTRKAERQRILAEKDIEHADWLHEDAENRKARAEADIADFDAQYERYIEERKRPAFGGR